MILASKAGFLFRAPQNVIEQFPEYQAFTEFDDLLAVTVQPTAYTTFTSAKTQPVYLDGMFTNHSEITLKYLIENGFRCSSNIPNPFHPGQVYDNSQAPSTVPDANDVLDQLGYNK